MSLDGFRIVGKSHIPSSDSDWSSFIFPTMAYNISSLSLSCVIGVMKKFNCLILQHPRTFTTDAAIHRLKFFNLIYSTMSPFLVLLALYYMSSTPPLTRYRLSFLSHISFQFLLNPFSVESRAILMAIVMPRCPGNMEIIKNNKLCMWRYMKDWSKKQLQVALNLRLDTLWSIRLDHGALLWTLLLLLLIIFFFLFFSFYYLL